MQFNYVGFTTLFISKYDSVAAKTKLYSEHQGTGELTEPFITTQHNLFDRLNERVPEAKRLQTVANLLDLEISSRISFGLFTSLSRPLQLSNRNSCRLDVRMTDQVLLMIETTMTSYAIHHDVTNKQEMGSNVTHQDATP